MCSVDLQRKLIFTHCMYDLNLSKTNLNYSCFLLCLVDQPHKRSYYEDYMFPSYKNQYFNYTNSEEGNNTMSIGTWHILPVPLSYEALHNKNFSFQAALFNSSFNVLIYFHGTGETRASSTRKYQLFTQLFHVIAFDYRSKWKVFLNNYYLHLHDLSSICDNNFDVCWICCT